MDDGWYGEPARPYWLEVGGRIVASLHAPRFAEMFWASWEVRPLNADSERLVRDPLVWQKVAFRVIDDDGIEPNEYTFSRRFGEFCEGQTNRLDFRSLWPREWEQPEPEPGWFAKLKQRLSGWFSRSEQGGDADCSEMQT